MIVPKATLQRKHCSLMNVALSGTCFMVTLELQFPIIHTLPHPKHAEYFYGRACCFGVWHHHQTICSFAGGIGYVVQIPTGMTTLYNTTIRIQMVAAIEQLILKGSFPGVPKLI